MKTKSHQFGSILPRPISHRQSKRQLVLVSAALIFSFLFLVGCGPERSGRDPEQLAAEAQRVALAYADNQDVAGARAQIEALDVANPKQWLLLMTERTIAEGGDPATIAALVQLTHALGLRSSAVTRYGRENNLLADDDTTGNEIVVASTPAAIAQSESGSATATDAAPAVDANAEQGNAADSETESAESSEGNETDALPAPTAEPSPTSTPESARVRADTALNLRRGPGLLYDIVGGLQPGDELNITGKNDAADWWQVLLPGDVAGWVYAPLVQTAGDVNSVAVAANIPPPPEAPAAPEPQPEAPPAEEPPADEQAPPPSDKPHFSLTKVRLWNKNENDGCQGKHLLRIHVLDANGVRLNGVALQGIYVGETIVTGSQGKGDGVIEYDLHGSGEGFRVIRDADGREATSDSAEGFTTRSIDIPKETLINAGYCANSGDCDVFYASWGCHGHHSWEAEFTRNY